MKRIEKGYEVNYNGVICNTFKELCEITGINYSTAKSYRRHHKELDDLDIINIYKKGGPKNLVTRINNGFTGFLEPPIESF